MLANLPTIQDVVNVDNGANRPYASSIQIFEPDTEVLKRKTESPAMITTGEAATPERIVALATAEAN